MIEIQSLIVDWYSKNSRELPWREIKNPYLIWLSEVILQQTRVAQGLEYYLKFTRNYPTVHDLADADEQEVLNDWQGLGYYSRARNLHATAKIISKDLKGKFPKDYIEIRNLKGIGDYTAAAIASFAYNLPHAVVDGNVYRVLSRVFDIDLPIDSSEGKKAFQLIADELLDKKNPGLFNQAIMEFGALYCVPNNPECSHCPLNLHCESLKKKTIAFRPVKKSKTKVRNRYFIFFIQLNSENQSILLRKRTEKDIWKNLYEFPKIEFHSAEEMEDFLLKNKENSLIQSQRFKHILSHQHLHAHFIIPKKGLDFSTSDSIEIKWSEFHKFPLPRLIDRFVEENATIFHQIA